MQQEEFHQLKQSQGFLVLSKKWDFPGLAFKWLFLNQLKSLDAGTCNSKSTPGISAAHQHGVVSSA